MKTVFKIFALALLMFAGSVQAQTYCAWSWGPTDPLGTPFICAEAYAAVNAANAAPGNEGLAWAAILDDNTGAPFQGPICPPGSGFYNGACSGAGMGSPGYAPPLVPGGAPASPIAPPANPWAPTGILAAATGALLVLAGIGAAVGAAPLVVAGAVAAAVHTGVAAVLSMPSAPPTAQAAVEGMNPPLKVTLRAAPTDAPAPVAGDTSPPSVVTNPNGQFAPGGGGDYSSGSGATGGWAPSTGGATGEWTYTPAPTAANLTPAPTAQITSGGYELQQQIAPTSTGTASGALTVARASDGSIIVTQAATVPVSTSGGSPTTAQAATTSVYDNAGRPVSTGQAISPTLGNGDSSNGGQGLTLPGSSLGSGATPESTNAGGCGSGGTCETTQLANKGLLTAIYDWLNGTSTPPETPVPKTGDQVRAVGLSKDSGPFGSLLAWGVPEHVSTCPSGSFEWNGTVYTFDAHCQLVLDHFGVIRTVMTAMFAFSGVLIVLRA